MIQGVSAVSSVPNTELQRSAERVAEPRNPIRDPSSPFEIAQQIQEVQVQNLKTVLEAQTYILDLLA